MAWADEMQELSDDVINTFGEAVTYGRVTGGTFSSTTGRLTGGTTLSVAAVADVQERTQFVAGGMDGSSVVVEQVVFLFDVVSFAELDSGGGSLGSPRENDTITHDSLVRRVVGAGLQANGKMWRVVTRVEKRKG